MKYVKNIGISLAGLIVCYLFFNIIITFFSFNNIFSDSVLSFFKIAILFISVFISSFIFGKTFNNKILLYSSLYGLLICIFLTIVNLILYNSLFKGFYIYYLIIIMTSILGAIIRFKAKS